MAFQRRHFGWLAASILAALSLVHAVKPVGSGAAFGSAFVPCDLVVNGDKILAALGNHSHIRGFLVMSLVVLASARARKGWVALLFVLALTATTEILQMWSPTRHCRLTDPVPNLSGLLAAGAIYYLVVAVSDRVRPRPSP